MADYAAGLHCVRAAAGGFSPGGKSVMPGEKSRPQRLFLFMLEARGRSQLKKEAPELQKRAAIRGFFPGGTARVPSRAHTCGANQNLKEIGQRTAEMKKLGRIFQRKAGFWVQS